MAKLTQDELLEIFEAVKKEVKPYEKGTVKARIDLEGKYDLWSEKPIEAFGRKYPAMNFVSVILQSGYVGFYFMPVYGSEKIKHAMPGNLMKTLKRKACFHIKTADKQLMKEIKEAMKLGYDGYKKMGWVS